MNVRMKESNINLNENIRHLALVACRVGPAFEMSFSWSTNTEAFKKKVYFSENSFFNGVFHVSIGHWHHLLYRVGFLIVKIHGIRRSLSLLAGPDFVRL